MKLSYLLATLSFALTSFASPLADTNSAALSTASSAQTTDSSAATTEGSAQPTPFSDATSILTPFIFPPYPSGPYTPGSFVGGNGGKPYAFLANVFSGDVVSSVTFFDDNSGNGLDGLSVTFSNGQTVSAGGTKGPLTYNFKINEVVVHARLWSNKEGNRCARVSFTTNLGNTFSWGKDPTGLPVPVSPPIGSGVLVGFAGGAGTELDSLSFIFLQDIQSVTIGPITYVNPPVPGSTVGIQPQIVANEVFNNSSPQPVNFTCNGSQDFTETTSFSSSLSTTYGIQDFVVATLFDIIEAGGVFQWGVTGPSAQPTNSSSPILISWEETVVVPREHAVFCSVIVHDGRLTLSYTGQVNVVFSSGTTFSYPTTGTMNTVVWSQATVTIDDRTDTLFGFGNATNATTAFVLHTLS